MWHPNLFAVSQLLWKILASLLAPGSLSSQVNAGIQRGSGITAIWICLRTSKCFVNSLQVVDFQLGLFVVCQAIRSMDHSPYRSRADLLLGNPRRERDMRNSGELRPRYSRLAASALGYYVISADFPAKERLLVVYSPYGQFAS